MTLCYACAFGAVSRVFFQAHVLTVLSVAYLYTAIKQYQGIINIFFFLFLDDRNIQTNNEFSYFAAQ